MQLTTQLGGRKVVECWRNGTTLVIRCEDGYEMTIGWRDPDTGQPIKGEPVIVAAGLHVIAKTAKLFEVSHRREVGLQ